MPHPAAEGRWLLFEEERFHLKSGSFLDFRRGSLNAEVSNQKILKMLYSSPLVIAA